MGKLVQAHYKIPLGDRFARPDRSFRIAVIADLHNQVYRSDVPAVIRAIRDNGCEAVLSAGDLVLRKGDRFACDKALELIGGLSESMPVFVVNGNHEMRMWRRDPDGFAAYERSLKEMGVTILHNRTQVFEMHGVRMSATGLELDRTYFRNKYHQTLDAGKIRALVGDPPEGTFHILLAHHPKYFDAYAAWGADLVVAGHLHGGIARLPYLGGVVSPDPGLFPHYDRGLYRIAKSRMAVSAGLGTHTINFRFNNPAEVVILTIPGGRK